MMGLATFIFWLIGATLIFGLTVSRCQFEHWVLRAWVYGRQQLIVLAIIHISVFLLVPQLRTPAGFGLIAALTIVLSAGIFDMIKLTPFYPVEIPDSKASGEAISTLIYNVLQENDQKAASCDMLLASNADIIFLCETNAAWREALSPLEAAYPYTYLLPLEENNGLLFYSRLKILAVDERYLTQDHVPSLKIDLQTESGHTVHFYGLHPRPPRPEDATEKLDRELMMVAEEVCNQKDPVLVAGDLNEVSWSRTIAKFKSESGLRDPRVGRGVYNSYHAQNPFVFWPLDHILASEHFSVVRIQRGDAANSDHCPMQITFAI